MLINFWFFTWFFEKYLIIMAIKCLSVIETVTTNITIPLITYIISSMINNHYLIFIIFFITDVSIKVWLVLLQNTPYC